MSEKLKKITKKLSELIPRNQNPQGTYDHLIKIIKHQKDYFIFFRPNNIIKLSIYLYSYKTTGNFTLGDKMVNSLSFANLFATEGKDHTPECEDCIGNGEVHCKSCDGSEEVDCDNCLGTGEVSDDDYDKYPKECDQCHGGGRLTCGECNSGMQQCPTCNGMGEIESNDLLYDFYLIATWNREIAESCELNENTMTSAMSEYDFGQLKDEYIVLSYNDDKHAEINNIIEPNEFYCTLYSTEPNLTFTNIMTIDNPNDNSSLDSNSIYSN